VANDTQGSDGASALRQSLAEHLKNNRRLRTPAVEAAFRAVPRHLFLPEVPVEDAYRDEPFVTKRLDDIPVSSSSQPSIMATMLEQLGLEPGHRVLEIGAGTGYNAALMAQIVGGAGQVDTVEIDEDIAAAAREHLKAAGFAQVTVVCGDGSHGFAGGAPYDRIILTAGSEDIAPAWREQMRAGGRIVLPLTIRGAQKTVAFESAGDHLASVSVFDCGFMMLRGAFAETLVIVKLGPEPGLHLIANESAQLDADAVYRSLIGSFSDRPTGVHATPMELWARLSLWLALREPGLCRLWVRNERLEGAGVPGLLPLRGKGEWASASALTSAESLSILMQQPGTSSASDSPDDSASDVFVRSFGPDEKSALVGRLIEQVRAWDAASRTPTERLRIRAYPKDVLYAPQPGEMVVEKRWTRLVLGWPGG